ncbi:MAG: HAD family hydrolase [Planctomycetota bacterium]|jgi:FMN phosphatase YigB (HAD superfamily)
MHHDAIVFDLGNTLLPWGDQHSEALYSALAQTLTDALGPVPDFLERAQRLRDAVGGRKYTTMREATVDEYVDIFCDGAAPTGLADAVGRTVREVFLEHARFPEGTRALLERFARRGPLAVLSNFFMTSPVEEVLQRAQLFDLFRHVEVSATSGFMKPHPTPFRIVLEELGTPAERTLMVGDDYWADIVGGHRAGLLTALTHEHRQGPTSDPRTPDIAPGRVIRSLAELLED